MYVFSLWYQALLVLLGIWYASFHVQAEQAYPFYLIFIHSYPASQFTPRSTQQHAAPRSTTQHHAAPRSITQHCAAPRNTTQHHATPRNTTQHHATPRSTHAAPQYLYCLHTFSLLFIDLFLICQRYACDRFIDSIGVNTHWDYPNTPYGYNSSLVMKALVNSVCKRERRRREGERGEEGGRKEGKEVNLH